MLHNTLCKSGIETRGSTTNQTTFLFLRGTMHFTLRRLCTVLTPISCLHIYQNSMHLKLTAHFRYFTRCDIKYFPFNYYSHKILGHTDNIGIH